MTKLLSKNDLILFDRMQHRFLCRKWFKVKFLELAKTVVTTK